jgi:4'-phosphopantetheinyl transferase EntD
VVGTISHCTGYRVAAVPRGGDLLALGVDAGPAGPLPRGVLDAATVSEERGMRDGCRRAAPEVCWGRVLFSAKESVCKAWFPPTGRPLDFLDAFVRLDVQRGAFSAVPLVPGQWVGTSLLSGSTGRWAVVGGLVPTGTGHRKPRMIRATRIQGMCPDTSGMR